MRHLILPLLLLAACSASNDPAPGDTAPSEKLDEQKEQPSKPRDLEPEYITVDHILIAYSGAPRMSGISRSLADAKKLAYDLLEQINNGDDWASLKKEYSNDPGPTGEGGGPYAMSNTGALRQQGVTPRGKMVPAFGGVGFQLEVGEVRIADHDPVKSPFGYHIIKRVK